jgi:hypothetical protein
MLPEYELPLPPPRPLQRAGPLIAIGAFGAGLVCAAQFVVLPVRPLPADDKAMTVAAVATPPARSLFPDDGATSGESVATLPAKTACGDQVWPRFTPECLTRTGEPPRPVRLVEPNRVAESTSTTKPRRPVIRGRETLGIAVPMRPPPFATPVEQRPGERTRRNRSGVAGNRAPPGQVDPFAVRPTAAPAHGQPHVSPAMAYAPERTRRTPSPSLQSYAYPHVQNY